MASTSSPKPKPKTKPKPQPLRHRTPRLLLRDQTPHDIVHINSLESLPQSARYQIHPPHTWEDSTKYVEERIEEQGNNPRLCIDLVVLFCREFLGRVGCWIDIGEGKEEGDGEKDGEKEEKEEEKEFSKVTTPTPSTAELWYSILPSFQGLGFATEAVSGLIEILKSHNNHDQIPKVGRLLIETDPRNEPSCRVAERLGFKKGVLKERTEWCKGEWIDSLYFDRDV